MYTPALDLQNIYICVCVIAIFENLMLQSGNRIHHTNVIIIGVFVFPPLATLTSYFEEYGEITALTLKKNPFNGKSK